MADAQQNVDLADNDGTPFRCGTCKFFGAGFCNNPDKRLKGKQVEIMWCCNFYRHEGMRIIIK